MFPCYASCFFNPNLLQTQCPSINLRLGVLFQYNIPNNAAANEAQQSHFCSNRETQNSATSLDCCKGRFNGTKGKGKLLPSYTWHHPHASMCYDSHKYWSLKSATHNSTVGEEGINKLWADGVSRRGEWIKDKTITTSKDKSHCILAKDIDHSCQKQNILFYIMH